MSTHSKLQSTVPSSGVFLSYIICIQSHNRLSLSTSGSEQCAVIQCVMYPLRTRKLYKRISETCKARCKDILHFFLDSKELTCKFITLFQQLCKDIKKGSAAIKGLLGKIGCCSFGNNCTEMSWSDCRPPSCVLKACMTRVTSQQPLHCASKQHSLSSKLPAAITLTWYYCHVMALDYSQQTINMQGFDDLPRSQCGFHCWLTTGGSARLLV